MKFDQIYEEIMTEGLGSVLAKGALTAGLAFGTPNISVAKQEEPTQIVQKQDAEKDYAVNILARTIWAEAKGDLKNDNRAYDAVATVIQNRAEKKFGKSEPMDMVKIVLTPYQFSCWNGWTKKSLPPKKERSGSGWEEAVEKATQLVDGTFKPLDELGDATFYHNPKKANPSYYSPKLKQTKIGNHVFYNAGGFPSPK